MIIKSSQKISYSFPFKKQINNNNKIIENTIETVYNSVMYTPAPP